MQKSLPEYKKIVQRVVNKYIRLRDDGRPCISCGKRLELQAGHYIAQGSCGLLRFNEENINGQCVGCNKFMHGNLINYRIGLVEKIGEKQVKYLENHRHDLHKWTREELETIKSDYQAKIKDLEEFYV